MGSSIHLRSMTGFGRAQRDTSRGQFLVELRTVNNRFLDINLALPRELAVLETPLRTLLKQEIRRGKLDCRIRFTTNDGAQSEVILNLPLAEKFLAELKKLQSAGASGDIPIDVVANFPGVVETQPVDVDEQVMWRYLHTTVEAAVEALNRERSREGLAIADQLVDLGARFRACLAEIDKLRQTVVDKYRERLNQRIQDMLSNGSIQADPGRLEQEVALFADRADISEEVVRLGSHLERLDQLLRQEDIEPTGKALDFLMQEFNREINTIASKARDTEITNLALEMKSLAEQMREQIQNVE